jgi:predicted nucleotidyltransferase
MEKEIKSRLQEIERDEDMIICLAVESGSRAWGFPSSDSDYDVRFLYLRKPAWYLAIDFEEKSDVIELPTDGVLDISGWDVRKALKLFRKSNPPLLEWLQCPLVYQERFSFASRLRDLLPAFFSPKASFFHYLHMARGNFRDYLQGEVVWRKKYFYVLRPLLAIRWIEKGLGPVPIEFGRVLDATLEDAELRSEIESLLEAKKSGQELDKGPLIEPISGFIESELARHEKSVPERTAQAPSSEGLNALFRETLQEVWGDEAGTLDV